MTGTISVESILIPVESYWIQMEAVFRPLRIESPHAMCHVTSRGHVRQLQRESRGAAQQEGHRRRQRAVVQLVRSVGLNV
ncbi:MAG: hypothetical protein ND866_24550, partial [Pyrinomonadaceae bacterium]|nr:hypothetical protein [Pyrinomonadaceae bacterium]